MDKQTAIKNIDESLKLIQNLTGFEESKRILNEYLTQAKNYLENSN